MTVSPLSSRPDRQVVHNRRFEMEELLDLKFYIEQGRYV